MDTFTHKRRQHNTLLCSRANSPEIERFLFCTTQWIGQCVLRSVFLQNKTVVRPSISELPCWAPQLREARYRPRALFYRRLCRPICSLIVVRIFVLLSEREVCQVVGSATQFSTHWSLYVQGQSAFHFAFFCCVKRFYVEQNCRPQAEAILPPGWLVKIC